MALIKCPECGKDNVSDFAESCPQCGYPVKGHFEEIVEKRLEQEETLKYKDLTDEEISMIKLMKKVEEEKKNRNKKIQNFERIVQEKEERKKEVLTYDPFQEQLRLDEEKRIKANIINPKKDNKKPKAKRRSMAFSIENDEFLERKANSLGIRPAEFIDQVLTDLKLLE